MQTISVQRKIESEALLIPELKSFIGKEVFINITPIKNRKLNNNSYYSKLGKYNLNGAFDNIESILETP